MSGRKSTKRIGSLEFIGEEPLSIRIDDRSHTSVMRTPGEEEAHAAGFCLGEGLVDSPDDIKSIDYDENQDPNVIDVRLDPGRHRQDDLEPARFEDGFEIGFGRVKECIDRLGEKQDYYRATRSSHAALILDDRLEPVSFAEDVGRHNALDKAVGKAFMDRKLSKARVAVLSSRNSSELVQKAARARLPVMISVSRPTALAVEMGQALNLTLVFAGKGEPVIVCGEQRIKRG